MAAQRVRHPSPAIGNEIWNVVDEGRFNHCNSQGGAPMLRSPLFSLLASLALAGTPLHATHAWAQACPDADGDGYTDLACGGTDCDDTDPTVHPGATEVCDGKDTNCDGVRWATDYDRDGDGVPQCSGDCDDNDANRYPGAPELCNGVDDDCNNSVPLNERDLDHDGVRVCDVPSDCNDNDATIAPNQAEVCGDNKDNNCNGQIDEAGCICPDRDGDGHTDAVCGGDDCNDFDATIYPGAPEQCTDGIDNNCNSQIDCADAGCATDATCQNCAATDQDGDGYSTAGGICGPIDCDDTDPSVHPGATEVCDGKDTNCDGVRWQTDYDRDGDGVPQCGGDCDDNDANRYPGAPELCNGVDDDCNNSVPLNERDLDHDGVRVCDVPSDCNDNDATIAPNQAEVCGDNKDNNCNGQIDEAGCICPDRDADGHTDAVCGGDDCNDFDATIYPGAPEQCTDGIDNNCNGTVDCAEASCATDPTCQSCLANDQDGDGYSTAGGLCGPVDCDDTDPSVHPGATEVCDGKDTNCDGVRWSTDYDRDGDGIAQCGGDCDDNDPTRYPGAPELCNGIDDNCDNTVPLNERDLDGDGYRVCDNPGDCNDNDPAINPGATEICGNGIDENCDGVDAACTGTIDYDTQIQPIWDAKCIRCHGGSQSPNLSAGGSCYNLVGVAATCTGQTLVVAGSSAASYLMDKVRPDGVAPACGNKMPAGSTGLSQSESDTIAQWIDQGASCGSGTGGVCMDHDGDGYGAPGDPSCPNGPQTDCNDNDPAVNPGGTEVLGNGIDDDCNPSTVDDGGTIGATPEAPHDQLACDDCHINGANGSPDYAAKVPNSQCEQCHTPAGALKASYPTAPDVLAHTDANGSGNYAYTNACVDCHDPMASNMPNIKHVRSVLAGSAVANSVVELTALSGSGSFADGPPHDNNVCETCHTMTNHHRHDGTAPGDLDTTGAYVGHNDSADCTTCHTHDTGFQPSCGGCHDVPPATGTHLKHFGGTKEQAAYGSTTIAADVQGDSPVYLFNCGNCHPMDSANHRNGIPNSGGGTAQIELYNPAAPAGSIKALNPPTATYTPGSTLFTDNFGMQYTQGTCDNVYCHSNPVTTTSGPVPLPDPSPYYPPLVYNPPWQDLVVKSRQYRTPTWGVDTLGCSGCHEYPIVNEAPADSAGAGDSHGWLDDDGYVDLHVWNMGFGPLDCRTCHYDTVVDPAAVWTLDGAGNTTEISDIPIANHAAHVNGHPDVAFTPDPVLYPASSGDLFHDLSTAAYDPVTKTCSDVACHHGQTVVEWGTPYRWWNSQECNVCHQF